MTFQYKNMDEAKKEFGENALIFEKLNDIVSDSNVQLRIVNEIIYGLCNHCWNHDDTVESYGCRCWDDS